MSPSAAGAAERLVVLGQSGDPAWAHCVERGPLESLWRQAAESRRVLGGPAERLPQAATAALASYPRNRLAERACGGIANPEELPDFGEVLRHELNNTLTGILGNAELLLVELRRRNIELPRQAELRLETIATLALRMRETVRRLSEEWEAQTEHEAEELEPHTS